MKKGTNLAFFLVVGYVLPLLCRLNLILDERVLVLMLAATTSRAQEPEVARNTCSECHATQKGQLLSPNLRAPTWVEIANTPGVTEAALLVT